MGTGKGREIRMCSMWLTQWFPRHGLVKTAKEREGVLVPDPSATPPSTHSIVM